MMANPSHGAAAHSLPQSHLAPPSVVQKPTTQENNRLRVGPWTHCSLESLTLSKTEIIISMNQIPFQRRFPAQTTSSSAASLSFIHSSSSDAGETSRKFEAASAVISLTNEL